jgi:hypothetical protein
VTLPLFYDARMSIGAVADTPIVYTDEDLTRLLGEVERRSCRRRQHQQRGAQAAACVVLAMVAWLSFLPAANGAARAGHHPVAVIALNVGRASQFGA